MNRATRFSIAGYGAHVALAESPHPQVPTVLALHGFTGCGSDFLTLRDSLGPDSAHWIFPDFMGHGASDAPTVLDPYLLPATLQLIDRARALAPDPDKVLLLAYSMGARLALHYLKQARSLPAILIGTSPGLASPVERANRRKADRRWIRLLSAANPVQTFADAWEKQSLIAPQTRLPEPLRSELAQRRRLNRPAGLIQSLLAVGTGALPSLWNELDSLPPLTLAVGSVDRKFGQVAAEMAYRNPHLYLTEIPGAGHSPHLEQPEALARLIRSELASLA